MGYAAALKSLAGRDGFKCQFLPKHRKCLYTIAYYTMAMVTTIQVSGQLVSALKKRKQYDKESYEEVIWNLVEDTIEVSEQTKKEIALARKDYKAGKFFTHEQVKRRLGV